MTDERQVNIPLLRKAVEWAEAEAAKPRELREWEQRAFVLPSPEDRTDFCASKWFDPSSATDWAAVTWQELGKSDNCGTCFCIAGYIAHQVTGNLDYSLASEIALDALGLKHDNIGDDSLFYAGNTIEDVRRIAEELAGERL